MLRVSARCGSRRDFVRFNDNGLESELFTEEASEWSLEIPSYRGLTVSNFGAQPPIQT